MGLERVDDAERLSRSVGTTVAESLGRRVAKHLARSLINRAGPHPHRGAEWIVTYRSTDHAASVNSA